MRCRSTVGWKSKSKSARVLRNGNRAKRRRALRRPVAGGVGLLGDQPGEEVDVGPLSGAGVLGEGGEHLGGPVQLQVAEVVLDLFVDAQSPFLLVVAEHGQVGHGDLEVASPQLQPARRGRRSVVGLHEVQVTAAGAA